MRGEAGSVKRQWEASGTPMRAMALIAAVPLAVARGPLPTLLARGEKAAPRPGDTLCTEPKSQGPGGLIVRAEGLRECASNRRYSCPREKLVEAGTQNPDYTFPAGRQGRRVTLARR